MKSNLQNKILIPVLTFLGIIVLALGSFYEKSEKTKSLLSYEGIWQYKVSVEDSKIFNPERFYPKAYQDELKKENIKIEKRFKYGNQDLKLKDIFYTGYFQLNPKESFEIAGNYNPKPFALNLSKINFDFEKAKESRKYTELFWTIDLAKKKFNSEPSFWVVRALYDKQKDQIYGATVVLNCANGEICHEMNIARWTAKRIANANFYNQKNYSKKAWLSEFLMLFDRTGDLSNKILSDENDQNYLESQNNYVSLLNNPHSKVISYSAVLPAKAYNNAGNPLLNELCDPTFCAKRAVYYKFGGNSTEQACQAALSERNSLCCTGNSDARTCQCHSVNDGGDINSLCCCQAIVSYYKTVTTETDIYETDQYGKEHKVRTDTSTSTEGNASSPVIRSSQQLTLTQDETASIAAAHTNTPIAVGLNIPRPVIPALPPVLPMSLVHSTTGKRIAPCPVPNTAYDPICD
jgi:hypothetical protein